MASAEKERDRVEEKLAEVLPEMDKLQAGGQATHVTLVFIEKLLSFAQNLHFYRQSFMIIEKMSVVFVNLRREL